MTTDPWAIDASGGLPAYSGAELRLLLLSSMFCGAGTALGVRSGVRVGGSSNELLVQAQASPNMTVKVNPGIFIGQGAISSTQGAYSWCLDATTNLTIAASHATLDRTDLIAVRIRDANVDTSGARDGSVVVITGTAGSGTPALPTDASYFTIAQISVPHTVTNIGGGGGGTITDKRPVTAALGGIIPCLSTARPASASNGQRIYETDTELFYTWRSSLNKWIRDQQYLTLASQFQAVTTTTMADTGFQFFGESSSTYIIDSWLHTVAPTSGDLALQWSLPSGASMEWTLLGPAQPNVGTQLDTTIWQGAVTTTGPLTIGGLNSVGTTGVIRGTITTSSTSGLCKLQGAQSSASGTSFIRAASWMTTRQVA